MKYADELLKTVKEKTALQYMTDTPTEIGTCDGMEKNVGKNEVMRISRHTFPVHTMTTG